MQISLLFDVLAVAHKSDTGGQRTLARQTAAAYQSRRTGMRPAAVGSSITAQPTRCSVVDDADGAELTRKIAEKWLENGD